MQSALDQFCISISRVRDLIALHNSVKAQATAALDVSDMLRAALVLAVSALDYYVHEVVTLGMLEIHRGLRPEPSPSANTSRSAFSRFQVSLGVARQDRLAVVDIDSWLESEIQQTYGDAFLQDKHTVTELLPAILSGISKRLDNADALENEIREKLGYQSFQQPDKIADAIRLISEKKLWDEVGVKIGKPSRDIKQQLSFTVNRRNQIAHEADIDPSYSIGNRWPIDEVLVNDSVDFIEEIVESINQIIIAP